jgi:hypothetical protein
LEKVKALFVLAGYDAEHPGRMNEVLDQLNRRFAGAVYKFAGISCPRASTKIPEYAKRLGEEVIVRVFGSGHATTFCRDDGSPCAVETTQMAARGGKKCRLNSDGFACHRARPQNLVFICNARVWDEIFWRFGRAALIMRHETERIDIDDLVNEIECRRDDLKAAWDGLSNLGQCQDVSRLPMQNFQVIGGHDIAGAVQEDIRAILNILKNWRGKIYDPDFVNPKKGRRRGAYKLVDEIYFQKDRLHTDLAHIGIQSRLDVFHLLNAYHLYGAAIYPDFRFDVMAESGGKLGTRFTDILTGTASSPAATHVDVTPCDRVL